MKTTQKESSTALRLVFAILTTLLSLLAIVSAKSFSGVFFGCSPDEISNPDIVATIIYIQLAAGYAILAFVNTRQLLNSRPLKLSSYRFQSIAIATLLIIGFVVFILSSHYSAVYCF